MSGSYARLMENRPDHWTDYASCHDDARFTGRREWLAYSDLLSMRGMCAACPVLTECADWASDGAFEVFAAGGWWGGEG